ncbi:DUF998 domain-containing protein [soil metagenome]
MLPQQSPSVLPDNEKIISYQKLRTFIGFIGFFLPVAVVVGCYLFGAKEYPWQHSISHYYYSKMHIVFVCSLCVLGGFLITYRGKPSNIWESRVSNLAGYCAFGIASFPTGFDGFQPPENGTNQYISLLQEINQFWGAVHFAFAGILFACFVLFCLHFFQKPDEVYTGAEEIKFRRRKLMYQICGWGILISIIMIALFNFVIEPEHGLLVYSTFIFETTALWFFGAAWLIKGSAALQQVPVLKKVIKSIR